MDELTKYIQNEEKKATQTTSVVDSLKAQLPQLEGPKEPQSTQAVNFDFGLPTFKEYCCLIDTQSFL